MNKKLQVFVSSTYTDLIEERQATVQAILDAGHIPAGMELFKAGKSQINTIRKWIDESDVYIVILGGRYGAIEETSGLSYTELEYRYALSKNIPAFAIVLDDSFLFTKAATHGRDAIFEKNNTDMFNSFKSLIVSKIVRFVRNTSEIMSAVHIILNESSILESSIGWIRTSNEPTANNFIQEIFKQNSNLLNSILNSTDIEQKFKHYFDIYNSFDIKSISNVTTNKCIVDPLGNPISDIKNIRIDVSEVNDWMLNELNKNPTDLYKLSPRRFEELIAEVLMRKGYNVELTPATRDGGKDIYVAHKDDLGSFLYLVECKHYEPPRKVGVSVIRDLYGVLSKEKATYGIVVTTSDFTKPAQEFQQDIKFQMSLKNFNSIQKWICDVT